MFTKILSIQYCAKSYEFTSQGNFPSHRHGSWSYAPIKKELGQLIINARSDEVERLELIYSNQSRAKNCYKKWQERQNESKKVARRTPGFVRSRLHVGRHAERSCCYKEVQSTSSFRPLEERVWASCEWKLQGTAWEVESECRERIVILLIPLHVYKKWCS